MLAKTTTTQDSVAAAATTPTPTTANKEDSIVDKPKEETVKAEPPSAPPYMTREQDNKNFNNPFIVGAAVWQTSVTYWLNAYGEFLKNAPKMTQDWYDIFWKPWLNWMPQAATRQRQSEYRVIINLIE